MINPENSEQTIEVAVNSLTERYQGIILPSTNIFRLSILSREFVNLIDKDGAVLHKYHPDSTDWIKSTVDSNFKRDGVAVFRKSMLALYVELDKSPDQATDYKSISAVISFGGFMYMHHAQEVFEKAIGMTADANHLIELPKHVIGMRRDFFDAYLVPQPAYLPLDKTLSVE